MPLSEGMNRREFSQQNGTSESEVEAPETLLAHPCTEDDDTSKNIGTPSNDERDSLKSEIEELAGKMTRVVQFMLFTKTQNIQYRTATADKTIFDLF